MSYLAKGMMHQIQSFSLFLRKITSHLVLAENQFSQHLFFQAWFYKAVIWTASLKYFFPVILMLYGLHDQHFKALNLTWLLTATFFSFLHCAWTTAPNPHNLGEGWPASHLLYFRNVSFAQFLLVVWAKTHVLGLTEPFSLRQLSYFNIHYYRKRTGSSVQPEHSSNLATELPRAMGVGSSLRCAWLRNPLPSKCKKLLSTRKGYTCSYFLKWQQPKLESKCMETKVRGSM